MNTKEKSGKRYVPHRPITLRDWQFIMFKFTSRILVLFAILISIVYAEVVVWHNNRILTYFDH